MDALKNNLIKKIMEKKEFSQLPYRDVELVFERFDKDIYSDEEKIKLTRNFLRNVFSSFTSTKILSLKNPETKNSDWIMRKHLSTRERAGFFTEIYSRLLKCLPKKISVIDLGAGINGFSYPYFEEVGFNVNYVAVEAVGQLVKLMNNYFEKEKIHAKAHHLSLFDFKNLEKILSDTEKPRVAFLFKAIDSLEMLERNYSKKLIFALASYFDRIVVSFATESMVKRKKFHANRKWITDFIEENFNILNDFEIHGERFISFSRK